ncbi:hypothetical protein [Rhizobium sp. BK251]|uniref:hypothetical protein n=1 Tax=Rhizobium sp. BK251 TaxID=2512125 RepID=UPI0010431E62|nr:hypothetical protein [Rhizobium sp. BK251]TCL72127.1 hypothetical protein EV286_105388 [Rhizobium sp. BK251]
MKDVGEEIFWRNACAVLRDIGMSHLDPAHGAAVDVVRWCLLVRGRPTHHRQTFLEAESPALLAYLETLATSGDAAGWRTLEQRIRHHAELLHEKDIQPRARPKLAAIWHCLPELAGIGQTILDGADELKSAADFEVAPTDTDAKAGDGGDDKGSAGKTGSNGTAAKPRPSRLALPVVAVVLTETETKVLDLGDDANDANAKNDDTPDGPDGPTGPKPGVPK